LACVAITDHNTVRGALEGVALAEADPTLPRVIPGVEVSTSHGHLVALYAWEDIPRGLPMRDCIAVIKERGGLVYLPHPFDAVRRGAVAPRVREQAAGQVDLIEVLNGRSLTFRSVRNSFALAARHARPQGAGSDSHGRTEVGRAYVTIERQPTRDDLVALVEGGIVRQGLHWYEYALNWALQPMAVLTRFRRKGTRKLLRR
jgi:predicted metal-dependent phosphoesterase TrpH